MRTILIGVFLLIVFIISIPLFLIEIILGKINPRLKIASSHAFIVNVFRILLFLSGMKKTVIGVENVPTDRPVLYVSNHRSYYDILVSYVTMPNISGFVAKKEMEKVPFISTWMKFINCLFLDRDNVREGLKTILKGVELIKNGYSMFIAPEGTRNQKDEMLPFKEGSFKMAEKTGCPIIPVTINNTENALENHMPWIRKTHVVIEYGKPVYLEDLSKEERKFVGSFVQGIIKETYSKNASMIDTTT